MLRAVLVVLGFIYACGNPPGLAAEVAWPALQGGGTVVLLRHAPATRAFAHHLPTSPTMQ